MRCVAGRHEFAHPERLPAGHRQPVRDQAGGLAGPGGAYRADQTVVAEQEGEVVGFATVLHAPSRAELTELFVLPRWWRVGIGR